MHCPECGEDTQLNNQGRANEQDHYTWIDEQCELEMSESMKEDPRVMWRDTDDLYEDDLYECLKCGTQDFLLEDLDPRLRTGLIRLIL
jgi:predicted RNA-binding Zn-ribbon protein involved in translation (DUF1610 family)